MAFAPELAALPTGGGCRRRFHPPGTTEPKYDLSSTHWLSSPWCPPNEGGAFPPIHRDDRLDAERLYQTEKETHFCDESFSFPFPFP